MRYIILFQGLLLSGFLFKWNRPAGVICCALSIWTFFNFGIPEAGFKPRGVSSEKSLEQLNQAIENIDKANDELRELDSLLKNFNKKKRDKLKKLDDANLYFSRCAFGIHGIDDISRRAYVSRYCGLS